MGDATGRIFQQLETAQSEGEVRQKLLDRGFLVLSVKNEIQSRRNARFGPPPEKNQNRRFPDLQSAVQHAHQSRHFRFCVRSDLLAERAAAVSLRPVLDDVRQRVGARRRFAVRSLVGARLVPPVYVTAISAGERSGSLSSVIDQYISYLRVSTGFRKNLVTALIYPAILVVAVIVILTYLITFAMPTFAKLYEDLGIKLPATTQFMLDIAVPMRTYLGVIVGVVAVVALTIYVWTRSESGALAIDRFKPKIPLMGDIWLKAQIAQFVRTLSTLLGGGTPLVAALETSSRAIDSRLIATSVQKSAERVREGKSLHESLAESRIMPSLALEMIEVGEASGALSAMLTSVAEVLRRGRCDASAAHFNLDFTRNLARDGRCDRLILISLYLPLFSLQVGSGS